MAKSKKLIAALGLAGATLAFGPAAVAQESLRQVYAAPIYGDCYYDIGKVCGPARGGGAYAAFGPVVYDPYSSYAAVGVVRRPAYVSTNQFFWGSLRGGDWIAIHGANQ